VPVNAIRLLEQQHDQVADLLTQFQQSDDEDLKLAIFERIADNLAIHASIEERHFYPAVRAHAGNGEIALFLDEHLEIRKLVRECMSSAGRPELAVQVAALEGAFLHHVEDEENELFPKVKRAVSSELLEALGQKMAEESALLEEQGNARFSIEIATEPPAMQP
jgi:hemerythrin superfamily protein